jgi:hypothetical protein
MRALAWLAKAAAAVFALLVANYYCIRGKAVVIDPDIWWHVRVGDWIAAHHAVPRVGIFSQHIERPWTAYSWGFELLVSGIHHLFGLPGLLALLLCLLILISLAWLLALRWLAGSFWVAWLLALLAIYAAFVNPLRPVLLTLLFYILELLLIFETERRQDDRLLFWMGPLFLLWGNGHVQFVYGLFVFALYMVTRCASRWRRGPADARSSPGKLLALLALALLCPCLGPNGIRPYQVAFSYAGTTANYNIIQELSAMSFRRPDDYVLLALVMAACFALGRSWRRDWFRPLLLLVTALVSFRSVRDAWFVCIAAGFVLAEAARERHAPPEPAASRGSLSRSEIAAYATATLGALLLSFLLAMHYGLRLPQMARAVGQVYPVAAADFVRDSHLQGPLYNSYNWGGFLIYYLPEQPVSIDPRFDLYGSDLLLRSLKTDDGVDWKNDPDLARAHVVLLERWRPLAAKLAGDAEFRVVYADNVAVVLERQTRYVAEH